VAVPSGAGLSSYQPGAVTANRSPKGMAATQALESLDDVHQPPAFPWSRSQELWISWADRAAGVRDLQNPAEGISLSARDV